MLGIYLQRSMIVLFLCCFFLLPFYVFATPLLKLLGQPDDVAESSGIVACWLIPLHFSLICVSVPIVEILAVPTQELSDCVGFFRGSAS
jgi:Na+-driven multidrug efflux pump